MTALVDRVIVVLYHPLVVQASPDAPRSVDIAVGGRVECMKRSNDPRDMRVQCPLDNNALWICARFSNFEYHCPF